MHVHFHNTILVDDTNYIDVIQVDQNIYTQHMTKTEEPNVFSVKTQEDGDTSTAMLARLQLEATSSEAVSDGPTA